MWISKKRWAELMGAVNHRLTKLETHMKWIRWLVCAIFLMVAGGFLKQLLGY